MASPFCKRFVRNHVIAGFIEHGCEDDSALNESMKAKKGRCRLSPNEEARLMKEENEKRRRLRLQQVREQSNRNAARIRQAVKQEKNKQLQKIASSLQDELEREKEEKIRHLENQYENSLRSIGQGHREASEQVDVEEERYLIQQESNRRADTRYKQALEKQRREQMFQEYEQKYQIIVRQTALEAEKERAKTIAALPPPPKDPVLELEQPERKPVKMTDIDNFTTTHYHIKEEYAVDKVKPGEQEDARVAAEEEEIRTKEMDLEKVCLYNDRLSRARVRHNNALEKELLSHDYNQILHDLSDLQRADRDRRQKVVANIPKQVFEPPHRRLEDRDERQKNMEEAFEDLYMADTNYMGDLSLALDPHPPPDTPTATESLETSVLTDNTPLQQPPVSRVPTILKDTSNIQKTQDDSLHKQPEKVLKKLMDRIKTQRQEWMSKSMQEVPDDGATMTTHPIHQVLSGKSTAPTLSEYSLSEQGSPGIENVEPAKVIQPQKSQRQHPQQNFQERTQSGQGEPVKQVEVPGFGVQNARTVEDILEQQKQIEEQKRLLEKKLQELNKRQQQLNTSVGGDMSHDQEMTTVNGQVYLQRQGLVAPRSSSMHPQPAQPPKSQNTSAPPPFQNGQYLNGAFHTSQGYTFPPTGGQPLLNGQASLSGPKWAEPPQSNRSQVSMSSVSHSWMEPPSLSQYTIPSSSSLPNIQAAPPSSHFPAPPVMTVTTAASIQPHLSTSQPPLTRSEAPGTFITPSLPIPSTVSMSMPTQSQLQAEHMRKVKEYQQQLLLKHEQSKRVLAETRAEIERRRQELLQRFPQLEFKSPVDGSVSQKEQNGFSDGIQVANQGDPKLLTSTTLSPNKAAMTSLLSQLASNPYYSARLSEPAAEQPSEAKAENGKNKFQKVRKSLAFDADDTLHETPGKPGQSPLYQPSPGSTTANETTDLNDTTMSSSTERGSPALPGRRSGLSTTSESDHSQLSTARNDLFEQRQQELRRQLEAIQRQKEEILQRHQVVQRKLPPQQLSQPEDRHLDYEEITEMESSDDQSALVDKTGQRLVPLPFKKTTVLGDHRPHELSTIQEVETSPSSARYSGVAASSRHSLSSTERSSASRNSTENYQRPTQAEPAVVSVTAGRPVTDTGYQTAQLDEVMARASEFTPGILDRLKQKTNDVFYNLGDEDSAESYKQLNFTPDSLSTGPLDELDVSSTLSTTPGSNFVVTPGSEKLSGVQNPAAMAGQYDSTNDSVYSSKSWADEFLSFHKLQAERASLESQSKSVKESLDSNAPRKAPVDRSYNVVHMSQDKFSPEFAKVGSDMDLSQYPMSETSDKSDRGGVSPAGRLESELSQYPISSEVSPGSQDNERTNRTSPQDKDSELNQASLTSTTESTSSYMDLKMDSNLLGTREFDFIGHSRVQIIPDNSRGEFASPDGQSYNISGKVDYASTPNHKSVPPSTKRLSQISQFTTSPEETEIQAGSARFPQPGGHFQGLPHMDDSEHQPLVHPLVFTKVSGPSGLPSVTEVRESQTSDQSNRSDSNFLSKLPDESSLSQFTVTTTDQSSKDDLSLTQITVNTESPSKALGSLSQFSFKSSPDVHAKTDSSLSQYSVESPGAQNMSDKSMKNTSSSTSQDEEDESFVAKKFANLDQLIQESRDLITKHKQLITKNKEISSSGSGGVPSSFTTPSGDPSGFTTPEVQNETVPDSFGRSNTHYTGLESTGDLSTGSQISCLESSSFQQLTRESGITDDPDLTLLSVTSDIAEQTEEITGEITHRSDGTSGGDSILSFEQHEQSLRSSPDREFNDNYFQDLAVPRSNDTNNAFRPVPTVQRDAGDENVFRAVPVMVSPTLALSMKFSSSQDIMFNKPPVSWSKELEEDEKNVDVKPKRNSDPLISKVQEQRAELEKTATEAKQKVQKASGLNRALLPRSGGPGATTQAKTGTKATKESNKPNPMSLGQFISSRKEGASLMGKKSDNKPVPQPKPQRPGAGSVNGGTGMSKTLSSWKKSRGVKSTVPPPTRSSDLPSTSSKSFPSQKPVSSQSSEDRMYERNIRLQNRIAHQENQLSKSEDDKRKSSTHTEKVKEFQKLPDNFHSLFIIDLQKLSKLQENMMKKQMMKKHHSK
ncbi:microtubule-associated protein futsch-like isoform X7 [Ostrea edulis]|uniref:microtubule-associated protein futsch-like isoform X7 n=1 Tax=Ostrea edulis TaxID=37623 RepID=UPI0024AEF095|nr:microtubule-associated protein futsch-like isoform X7 [Ostrea edulis]